MKDGLVRLFPIALVDGTQLEREKMESAPF